MATDANQFPPQLQPDSRARGGPGFTLFWFLCSASKSAVCQGSGQGQALKPGATQKAVEKPARRRNGQ